MEFGYIIDIEEDLVSQILFAKQHFDFIEITSSLDLSIYTEEFISNIKRALKNFKAIGHIHWELSNLERHEPLEDIYASIEVLRKMGIKEITIHPFWGEKMDLDEIKRYNSQALLEISNFCMKRNLQLLVENIVTPPYNNAFNIMELTREIPNLGVTLDVGHANRISKLELERFIALLGDKIKHVHLHDNFKDFDHFAFRSMARLKRIMNVIRKLPNDTTITLEIFYVRQNGERILISGEERREILIKQLDMISKILAR